MDKYNKRKKELELKKLAADAENLEQDALGKKLDNIRKLRNLRLSALGEYDTTLDEALRKMEVELNVATIIDIEESLKKGYGYEGNDVDDE